MTLAEPKKMNMGYVIVIFGILSVTFFLPSLLDAWHSGGYIANRRYQTEIVAIRDIPRRPTRFAMIIGVDDRNVFLTDPVNNFRQCKIGDTIEYKMDGQIKLRDKFIYITNSCRELR